MPPLSTPAGTTTTRYHTEQSRHRHIYHCRYVRSRRETITERLEEPFDRGPLRVFRCQGWPATSCSMRNLFDYLSAARDT